MLKELTQEEKIILLNIAQKSVEDYILSGKINDFNINDLRLWEKQGAFVTLHKNGQLRGCVGRVLPGKEPLWQVIRNMAIAAAIKDNRFFPVTADELKDLSYEVSVLSVPQKIDDWRKINLGKDGVIIQQGLNSAVFLPQVATETGWGKEEFLSQLCLKAGLNSHCYFDKSTIIKTFQAEVFDDHLIKN